MRPLQKALPEVELQKRAMRVLGGRLYRSCFGNLRPDTRMCALDFSFAIEDELTPLFSSRLCRWRSFVLWSDAKPFVLSIAVENERTPHYTPRDPSLPSILAKIHKKCVSVSGRHIVSSYGD